MTGFHGSPFVELIPQGAMLSVCIVEMEDGQGARMRIELKGAMAAHESSRTTGLYDRRDDDVSLDEVERIAI